ncbi:MAG: hypothetical protein OER88_00950 [Planctomycetota bacterium]|nr:hypothetical protein [Planctomycetota bacterium]
MRFLCPCCLRTISDRRREDCKSCGTKLPSALVDTPEQTAARNVRKGEGAADPGATHGEGVLAVLEALIESLPFL